MPYNTRGADADVDDFDEYDPTPYGGGYDQVLTYGRPLQPSDETCYPPTSSSQSDEFDYDRPQYSSSSEPSAYGDEALQTEYSSYARPKPRPGAVPGYSPGPPDTFGASGGYGDRPRPESGYGVPPGVNRPGYGSERPGSEYESGYGQRPGSEFGSGHGRKSEYEQPEPEYGSGYGRKSEFEQTGSGYGRRPESEEPGSEYGSGYRRKPETEEPVSEYGSGYGRKPEYETPGSEFGSGYGKKPGYEAAGSEYGRKPEYETPGSEYGSGYGRKPGYGEEQEGGGGYGYGGRSETTEFEKPSYGDEPPRRPAGYGRPSYEGQEGYEKPSYGRSEEEESYEKPKYGGYGEESEEGYGRKKYVSDHFFP